MKSVKVDIRLADGGAQDWHEGPEFLARLAAPGARGVAGKELIHQLITDDWAAPPVIVTISWVDPSGHARKRQIEYD